MTEFTSSATKNGMKLPISVFLIALNEADRIGRAIASVKDFAAEIIVIDSGSTDGTQELCRTLGANVIHHDWPGYGEQKRFGEEQCREQWLLNIDADEIIPEKLAEEIRALFASGEPPCAAYSIDMRDMLPGESAAPPFAHSNRVVRLYDKRRARFSPSPVHDSVIVERGETGHLKAPAWHPSFRSVAHAMEKFNRYTGMQAADLHARGKRLSAWRIYWEFPLSFLKVYLLRLFILRGKSGFIYAVIYAMGRFLRIAKYEEKKRRRLSRFSYFP